MTHSDDEGLVLPPKLAPIQVAIVPIPKPSPDIMVVADKIKEELAKRNISVLIDRDEKKRPGFKFAEHEMKGTPIRLGIGQRDLANHQVEVARRDTRTKSFVRLDDIANHIEQLLETIQESLFNRAKEFRTQYTSEADDFDSFKELIHDKGGFVSAHWDGTTETELKIKELTKATLRCIPLDDSPESGRDMLTGAPSGRRVLFAKAY